MNSESIRFFMLAIALVLLPVLIAMISRTLLRIWRERHRTVRDGALCIWRVMVLAIGAVGFISSSVGLFFKQKKLSDLFFAVSDDWYVVVMPRDPQRNEFRISFCGAEAYWIEISDTFK